MDGDNPEWSQVVLDVSAGEVEQLETWLFEAGALAVTLGDPAELSPVSTGEAQAAASNPLEGAIVEPLPSEMPLWDELTLVGLFARGLTLGQLHDRLQLAAAGLGIAPPPWRLVSLADEPWERSWMRDFVPLQCAARLWVCPRHLPPPDPSAVTVCLDPGLAFGTGTHPTTAQCLTWLGRDTAEHRQPLAGRSVIDYGCGSGILAVAAALLGASTVLAVDIDEQALWATRDNARRNAVDGRITCAAPAAAVGVVADVMLANILYQPLYSLADTLAAGVRSGGHLVMAGMLSEQADKLMARYTPWFAFEPVSSKDGWALLCGVRNPP